MRKFNAIFRKINDTVNMELRLSIILERNRLCSFLFYFTIFLRAVLTRNLNLLKPGAIKLK